jgi:transcriptional regulator with XRE-family HTH domain
MVKLGKIRRARGMTQAALAELTGIDQANISRLEAGKIVATEGWARRIAAALNWPVEQAWELFEEEVDHNERGEF